MSPVSAPVTVRRGLRATDRVPIEQLLVATGFFNSEELSVALELVDDRLAGGEASHYRFLVAEADGQPVGYGCWGTIDGTVASADLYWLAVHPVWQGHGVGLALITAAETWIAESGRTRVYLETSSRVLYVPTRAFYLRRGYQIIAELEDFYAPGDGKVMYLKILA